MGGQNRRYIFLVIQSVLYGTFLSLDILGRNITLSNRVKFAVVVLCFSYVIITGIKDRSRKHKLLIYALAFTVISDFFILLSDYYLYGVLTFIIAQQLYGMRISELFNNEIINSSPISLIRNFAIRLLYQGAITFFVGVILWLMGVNIEALLVVSILYFISISTNVVRLFKLRANYNYRRDIRYFAIGMVLFLLCDINVGLFNLSDFLPVSQTYDMIYSISSVLMWTFYAPSQVLISLSGDTF